jgi:hypothetical protein
MYLTCTSQKYTMYCRKVHVVINQLLAETDFLANLLRTPLLSKQFCFLFSLLVMGNLGLTHLWWQHKSLTKVCMWVLFGSFFMFTNLHRLDLHKTRQTDIGLRLRKEQPNNTHIPYRLCQLLLCQAKPKCRAIWADEKYQVAVDIRMFKAFEDCGPIPNLHMQKLAAAQSTNLLPTISLSLKPTYCRQASVTAKRCLLQKPNWAYNEFTSPTCSEQNLAPPQAPGNDSNSLP